jgi:hypothetical protein
MRILLFLSESTPCSHCHIGNLCDFHISIALLIGAKSHISHSYTEHAQFLTIFRELLNTSHFWKRRMLSAHCWFHLRVEQRQNHSRLPSSRLTMQIMFRLASADLSPLSIVSVQVILKEALQHSGSVFTPTMTEPPALTSAPLCGSCFALYFQSLGSKFHLTSPKHLSIHGARLTHHMTGTLLPTSCSSACCFVQAPLSPQ